MRKRVLGYPRILLGSEEQRESWWMERLGLWMTCRREGGGVSSCISHDMLIRKPSLIRILIAF